jgi:hypothetical protein
MSGMNSEIMDSLAQGFVASAMTKVIFERKGINAVFSQATAMDGVKFAVASFVYKAAVRPIVANATGINLPKA